MTDSKAKTGRFRNEDCIPEPVCMRRKTDESGCSGFERPQSGAPGKLSAGRGHRDCVRRSQRSGHLRKRIRPFSWPQADGVSSGIFRHHRTIHAGRLRRRIVPKFPAILPKNARQSTKDCLRFLVVSQKIFWHAPPPGMIRCCLKIRALRSAETEHHHHRERGSGAGLLGWRFPRHEVCDRSLQKPGHPCESVPLFQSKLTAIYKEVRQLNHIARSLWNIRRLLFSVVKERRGF